MKAVKYILITAVVVFAAGGKMKADDFEPRIRDGVKFLGEVKIKFQPRYDLGGIAENYLAIWDWESYLNLARLVDSDPVRAAKLLDKFDDGEEKFAVRPRDLVSERKILHCLLEGGEPDGLG